MIRQFPSLFSVLLLLLVIWAPLPFGSVTVPFRSLLQGGIWVVLLVGFWTDAGRRRTLLDHGSRGVWLPLVCMLGLASLAWVQSTALPTSVVRTLSPGHVVAPAVAVSDSESTAAGVGSSLTVSGEASAAAPSSYLSWAPDASRIAAIGWLTAAAAFLCGALVGSRRERRLIFVALLVSGVFQVIYGGPRFRAGDPVIWGVTLSDPSGRLRGTFVNPNHAAFFLALLIPIAAAWLWLVYRYVREGELGGAWLLWLAAPMLVLLLLFGGVALTQSRAGVLVVVAVLIVLAGLMERRRRGVVVLGGVAIALLLGTVLARSGDAVLRRFWELQIGSDSGSTRLDVYGQVLDLWGHFPLLGSGLGTFRTAFSAHSDPSLRGQWWNAHSDWLELAATGGVLSLALAVIGLVAIAAALWRRRLRPSRQDRAVTFAVLGALVVAALHSTVDFGLAMPANQFTFALLLGLGVAPQNRSNRASRSAEDSFSAPKSSAPA